MRLFRKGVVPVLDGPVELMGGKGEAPPPVLTDVLKLNGTDQYVVIPQWSPDSIFFIVQAEYIDEDHLGTVGRTILGNAPAGWRTVRTTAADNNGRTAYSGQGAEVVMAPNTVPAVGRYEMISTFGGVSADWSGIDGGSDTRQPIYHGFQCSLLGANNGPDLFWNGVIRNVSFEDRSPLNGRWVTEGDDVRMVNLDSVATCSGPGLRIQLDIAMQESPDGNWFASTGGVSLFTVQVFNKDGPNPGLLRLAVNQTQHDWEGALDPYSYGEQLRIEFERITDTSWRCKINGVDLGTRIGDASQFDVETLGGWILVQANRIPAGAYMGNFILEDSTRSYTWAMDESSGTAVACVATGAGVPINGAWDVSTGKVQRAQNSRFYPINEGVGTDIKDILEGQNGMFVNDASPGGGWEQREL